MNKTAFLLPLLLTSIVSWRAQAITESTKMASDILRITNIEPIHQQLLQGYGAIAIPVSHCNQRELMIGVEVQVNPVDMEDSDGVLSDYDEKIVNFSSMKVICSPLTLNKQSLHFETVQSSAAVNRISCEANQVVIGISAWDSTDLYQRSEASNRRHPSEDNLSAIQLWCAPLKLTGHSWIGIGEIMQSPILGQPAGELVVDRHCSNPGQTVAAGLSGLKKNSTDWLVTNDDSSARLHEIRLHCSTLLPVLIDASMDTDNDGISNRVEALLGISFLVDDTDGDGVADIDEIYLDSDADGKVNAIESAILDQDLDGIFDEFDSDNNNPCIPTTDHPNCFIHLTMDSYTQSAKLPTIPADALNEHCFTGADSGIPYLEYSCLSDGLYAASWREHYNDTAWGIYTFSWADSRHLGALLGGFYPYSAQFLTAVFGLKSQKTVRRFQDGSKATGVWGGEIKSVLQQARPLFDLSEDYYTGTERWADYIGIMYFDKNDQLEAITLSKQDDQHGRTFVVKTKQHVKKLFVVDENYIYNHSR